MVHCFPFHDSISVFATYLLPSFFGYSPTAKQEFADPHETLLSEFDSWVVPFGLGTTDHSVPSHDSISVS